MADQVQRFDVVVVGAGPSGATAGYELARQGLGVLVLEKESVPRAKTCAGGLPAKVLDSLMPGPGLPVSSAASGIAFTRRFGEGFVRRWDRPLICFVERARFDELLVLRAVEAGARLKDGFAAAAVELHPTRCRVLGRRGERFECDYVVFADGAGGLGYRTVNPVEHRFIQLGMSLEVPASDCPDTYDRSLASVDWGTLADAYAWVFCKGDHFSIGCVGPMRGRRLLRAYLRGIVSRIGIEPEGELKVQSWPMPTFTSRVRLARDRALLIGDAAGMIDPLSGEGIGHAIESGKVAAQAICRVEIDGGPLGPTYWKLIAERLIPEILAQSSMRRFFALAPRFVHSAFRRHDRLWRLFCEALLGGASLSTLRREAPFSPMWPAIDAAAWLACRVRTPASSSGRLERMLLAAAADPHPALSVRRPGDLHTSQAGGDSS